jgi:hypothetical protein
MAHQHFQAIRSFLRSFCRYTTHTHSAFQQRNAAEDSGRIADKTYCERQSDWKFLALKY